LLAFGLIGLFVGPVVLSVTYTLLEEWVGQGPPRSDDGASAEATVDLPGAAGRST